MTMNQRTRRKGFWIGLALCALMLMSACDRDSPEAALRVRLQEMLSAASEGGIDDFMQGVTEDFAGNQGVDRAALHNMLRMQVLGRSNLSVTASPLQIKMQDDQAIVRFDAILAGGSGRFLPDSAQTYSITSGWRIEAGEWRVYYAQWEPLL